MHCPCATDFYNGFKVTTSLGQHRVCVVMFSQGEVNVRLNLEGEKFFAISGLGDLICFHTTDVKVNVSFRLVH